MIDPWQILILDSNTATVKDVKAAYARLLKQHRPDSDPEGFRRVREAYEIALGTIRERDARGVAPSDYVQHAQGDDEASSVPAADSPAITATSFALPNEVQSSFGELERAAASGNVVQFEAALQAFEEQCESAQVDSAIRVNALERSCAGSTKLLAAAVSDEMLLRLAAKGEVNLSHVVLSAWMEEERRARIVRFGRAVLDRAPALATPEGGLLMARVGVIVGLERPGLASSLGNLAYPHLPVDSRTQIMEQLEHETALGRAFEDVTPEMRPFWYERLRHAQEPHDWNDVPSLRALSDLVNHSRYMWQGWGIVQQLMPPERWAPVETRLRQQAHQVEQSAPRASKFPGWLLFPVLVIGFNLIRFLGTAPHDSRTTSPVSFEEFSGTREGSTHRRELWNTLQNRSSGTTAKDAQSRSLTPRDQWSTPGQPTIGPLPLGFSPPPSDKKPVVPVLPVEEKRSGEDYLRALQNGSLFDGSSQSRPPP